MFEMIAFLYQIVSHEFDHVNDAKKHKNVAVIFHEIGRKFHFWN